MPTRRRLIWASLVLSLGLLALALTTAQVPVDSGGPAPPPSPTRASAPLVARITVPVASARAPLEPTGTRARAVAARSGPSGPPVVTARLGQLVELAVTLPQPDAISIAGFDRIRPGSATTPARFSLVADRPGRFPLVLESSGQTVGVLRIGVEAQPTAHHRAPAP